MDQTKKSCVKERERITSTQYADFTVEPIRDEKSGAVTGVSVILNVNPDVIVTIRPCGQSLSTGMGPNSVNVHGRQRGMFVSSAPLLSDKPNPISAKALAGEEGETQ